MFGGERELFVWSGPAQRKAHCGKEWTRKKKREASVKKEQLPLNPSGKAIPTMRKRAAFLFGEEREWSLIKRKSAAPTMEWVKTA